MSTDDREYEYDRIDRLVDEDPIALRDLAWKLLDERDAAAIEHNVARAAVNTAEARGYRYAIERLRDNQTYEAYCRAEEAAGHPEVWQRWAGLGERAGLVAYLEATEGDDRG